ncbi:hypothetical protein O1611_g7575 [Lasiodiplodia mahajangana]|uniref:Uncharacterized protein n=1 Tax=Lasiodiplodia mahajangana TaxID=1108764 RepID=A0ACC2JEY4_9PEZI|nr:hypothetical protein O1611_g7575 [Lasiodiplodia mahajangana]
MADPSALIGLVSGIITFIDFGLKIVSEIKNVRDSVHGTTAEAHELGMIIDDVRHLNEQVKGQQLPGTDLLPDRLRMLAMVEECEKLASQLVEVTNTLKRRDGTRSKTLESARVAVRSFLKQDEIQALRSRLDHLNKHIREYLAGALQDLNTKLAMLQREQSLCVMQIKTLQSLYFPELRRRWRQIRNAEQRSNEWIYDSKHTSFVSWLESEKMGDVFFYITGRAGSGKSTLMKFIFENERTNQSLRKWADKAKLYTASYYFWNQGTDKQKTGIGLFQSLLYQILRSAPDLITPIHQDRLHHEVWEMEDLIDIFKQIARRTSLDTKFCFFIDGLDEYDGDEKDIIRLLQELLSSKHIKICASSRPGRQYESVLPRGCANWRKLAAADPTCQDILHELSARAGGVWLWVSLVTADIIKEAERNEEVATLRKIVDEFPADLHEYFARMIRRIPKLHREEMAQTFLVAVEELQPLPLYAFALLEKERKNSRYAIDSSIKPIKEADVRPSYPALKDRIRNRCSDLLIVDDEPHPVFLSHSVDFLHRTVRDFLQGDYDKQLKTYVKEQFDPLLSLSRICLSLLKALPVSNFRDPSSVNKVIGLTDELLYYAHEAEKRRDLEETSLVLLLDELDRVNSYHAHGATDKVTNHWTHARDSPASRGLDKYYEGGNCNFLALTVQARLVKYVRAKIQADQSNMQKKGRPLLDYALRPRRITPISMPYHSIRDDPSLDVDMVKLLLENGANPNQRVHLNGSASVWALFLLSIRETHMRARGAPSSASLSLNNAWYHACLALIQAGARGDCLSNYAREGISASAILNQVFERDRAAVLEQEMRLKENEAKETKSCVAM